MRSFSHRRAFHARSSRFIRTIAVVSAATLSFVAGTPSSLADLADPEPARTAISAGPDQANVLTGTIDAVTVYRGQAMVTRVIDVPGAAGLREIVVSDLPGAIVPSSLYAESADGLEVRSVSYRIRPIGEDTRESVRASEKAVRDARDALDAAKSRQRYMEWQRQYLDKLEGFVAPTAQAELKSGVLNAETLAKLTELITTRREAQSQDGHKLALEVRTLEEAVSLRERELGVLTASSSRTAREAVVFVNATKPGAKVRLSYLVNGANWTPSYNLRAADARAQTAVLEYQASVQQMSGEDWGSVQLTLSTATPALVACGPRLEPLTVALTAPRQDAGALAMLKDKSYDEAKKSLAAQQRDVERNRALNMPGDSFADRAQTEAAAGRGGEMQAGMREGAFVLSLDADLNDLACKSELLDLISSAKVVRKSKSEPITIRQGDEGVSVTYKIPARTTMPSRADQQLIQIAQMQLESRITRSATPSLTQYVYNEAEMKNTSAMVLLAGPAASYLGGEFVGSSGVPTVAAGESFRAGFGIDSSLRAGKELVERTETTQGGNRIIEFTYKLTVENFGATPAEVRLVDRLPSPRGGDIKLTMYDPSPSLSDDKDYQETDRKKNLLRWDITVPPGATGTKAQAVEYKFRLEFDKQMTLTEGQ